MSNHSLNKDTIDVDDNKDTIDVDNKDTIDVDDNKNIKNDNNRNTNRCDEVCSYCGSCITNDNVINKNNNKIICCKFDDNTNNNNIDKIPSKQPRKIDIHSHILPENIPDFRKEFGYGDFIQLHQDVNKPGIAQMWEGNRFFREIDEKCWSPEARLKDMDNQNIQAQILSTVPVMFSYWAKPEDCLKVSQFLNNHLYSIQEKYPTRFLSLGTIPMQHTQFAIQELKRCMNELHFVGIQIGSHVEKWNLDDARFHEIFREAEKLNACIFVHPWDVIGKDDMKKYWLPWLVGMPAETSRAICSLMFGGIFKKFPKLRFCFAHGGGSFLPTIGRIQHGYNSRPDLTQININGDNESPYKWLGHFWIDSLFLDQDALEYALKKIGNDRVCLGTDYPFPLGECYPLMKCGQFIENHKQLTFEMKEKLLFYNSLEFIGKEEKDLIDNKNNKTDENKDVKENNVTNNNNYSNTNV